jgi:predicted RecB family nuclease
MDDATQRRAQENTIIVPATALRLLQMCERRVWLDQYGDVDSRDATPPGVTYRLNQGVQHEEAIHRAAGIPTEPVVVSDWAEGVRLTRDLMARGTPLIVGAHVERTVQIDGTGQSLVMRGRIDRLERVDVAHRLGWGARPETLLYAPVEIKQYSRLSRADFLQLDAYLWMLEALQPQSVSGWFWLGQDGAQQPLYKTEHVFDEERFSAAIRRLTQILTQSDEPPAKLETHCKTCHWYSTCRSAASKQLHVSMLPGLSRQAKEHLQQQGITTLDQVVAMPPEALTQVKGIKTTAPAVHAQARAFVENRPVWYQALHERCLNSGVMFDLETDPYTNLPWSWGWVDRHNVAHVLITSEGCRAHKVELFDGRVVMVVPDKDTAWESFADAVSDSDCPIYHWTGFDAGVMRSTAPRQVREQLEERMHDLHRSFKRCVKFPVDGNSLKVVARYLNFEWAEYDAWDAAYWDYQRWLRRGDMEALARSCNYQRADVEALAVVWNWLVTHAGSSTSAR